MASEKALILVRLEALKQLLEKADEGIVYEFTIKDYNLLVGKAKNYLGEDYKEFLVEYNENMAYGDGDSYPIDLLKNKLLQTIAVLKLPD
jgi:hypothetical protein